MVQELGQSRIGDRIREIRELILLLLRRSTKIVDINLYKQTATLVILFLKIQQDNISMSKITASNINKKIKEINDMIDSNTKPVKKEEIFDSEEEEQHPVKSQMQIYSNQIKFEYLQGKNNQETQKQSHQKRRKKVRQEEEQYNYEENDEEISTFSADTEEDEGFSQEKQTRRRNSSTNKNRKIRTTITHEKLMEMNRIFKEYKEMREAGITDKNINLRAICNQLQLGYSTILHKYREFRHNSEVKGGALLSSRELRRKYKKSVQIEQHIRQAIKQTNLTNAVQISKYIYKTRKTYYSRAVICRHLAAVRNEQENNSTKNQRKRQVVQQQNNLADAATESQMNSLSIEQLFKKALKMLKAQNEKIIYLHEVVYQTQSQDDHLMLEKDIYKQKQQFPISLYIAVFDNKIILKKMKNGLFLSQDYAAFLQSIGEWRTKNFPMLKGCLFLLTNINQVHYDNFGSVRAVLQKYGLTKLCAPLVFQSPLEQMLMNIKQRVLQKEKEVSHKYLIENNLMSWRMSKEYKYAIN